eukprot:scaffold277444_cov28-Tisochrysis_lutea.AAC.6
MSGVKPPSFGRSTLAPAPSSVDSERQALLCAASSSIAPAVSERAATCSARVPAPSASSTSALKERRSERIGVLCSVAAALWRMGGRPARLRGAE